MRRSVPLLLAAALLAGCGVPRLLAPYRVEIQQGNYVTQEAVSQLHKGMTRDQVRFLLGTPLLADPFHADRWDYIFRRLRANSRELEERRLTLFFVDDRLDRVEGDVAVALGTSDTGPPRLPAGPPDAARSNAPATLPPLPPPEPSSRTPSSPSDSAARGPAPENLPPAAQPPSDQR